MVLLLKKELEMESDKRGEEEEIVNRFPTSLRSRIRRV